MSEAFSYSAFESRVNQSELGQSWINSAFKTADVWSLTELGFSPEECRISGRHNLYFEKFSLPWLKLLTKLTIQASIRSRYSLGRIIHRLVCLQHLDEFLTSGGYTQPELLTESLLHEFITKINKLNRQNAISYAVNLWREEGLLDIPFTTIKFKKNSPKIETIPEEVLHQIYEKFDLFPPPLERFFRLQLVLGCRIGEILIMPRHCLKKEGDKWFLLRWLGKRKFWQFYQIHPLVAELVQEQQRFLDAEFGLNSDFDKLFCTAKAVKKSMNIDKNQSDIVLSYQAKPITKLQVNTWLIHFRELADLKNKEGNRFKLTSHMFRRTKASIMAYCEAEDEYIAAVLGHASLNMLPHYRQRSLDRLEKEANQKGYVDMYGEVTAFKPRKCRYEKLASLLKVSTPLGECHRPTMLGDCQNRYACLSCIYHRVTQEDKSKLLADYEKLQQDLKQSVSSGQERRVTEINNLLTLIENRLQGLSELENLQGEAN